MGASSSCTICTNDKSNLLNTDKFIEEVKNTDWDFITNSIDVNCSYNNFIDVILNSLDRHCPYESKIIKIKKKTWLNQALINACKKNCYKIIFYKKTPVESKCKYKQYKNTLTSILRKAEKINMMSSYVKVNQILKGIINQ